MKKIIAILAVLLLASVTVSANSVGGDITPVIGTEDFAPLIWMCDSRVVSDDNVEQGRNGASLEERNKNYAFTGEEIAYNVLVMDKNGINKISDVFMTAGADQGAGNDIEANCVEDLAVTSIAPSCNARIGEEKLTIFDNKVQRGYVCTFNVEPDMSGEHWITAEVEDLDGLSSTVDENEFWFLNPVISLNVLGDLTFDDVRPGTDSYSDTLLVQNDAEEGSGVMMDMFITGTDFYDSSSSGAMCPTTNELGLSSFRYFVTNGAYSSATDALANTVTGVVRAVDAEGYLNIEYGDSFSTLLYNDAEILQAGPVSLGYYAANILSPGSEMALTFKLSLPEPCNGDFDSGSIYFWGEVV